MVIVMYLVDTLIIRNLVLGSRGKGHQRRKGVLSSERIQKLESIGFSWDPYEDAWNQMFQELKEYEQIHGDCNVPRGYSDNPKLGTWVAKQRSSKKKGVLSSERIQKLESIGFSWDPYEDAWNQMFQELQEYKRVHDHCNVPAKYNDNPQLGTWVDGQRQQKRQGKLSSKRIQKLEAIGFQWTLIKFH